jgi:hypothetical protein
VVCYVGAYRVLYAIFEDCCCTLLLFSLLFGAEFLSNGSNVAVAESVYVANCEPSLHLPFKNILSLEVNAQVHTLMTLGDIS